MSVRMDTDLILTKNVLTVKPLLEDSKLMGIVPLVRLHSFMMDKFVSVRQETT